MNKINVSFPTKKIDLAYSLITLDPLNTYPYITCKFPIDTLNILTRVNNF